MLGSAAQLKMMFFRNFKAISSPHVSLPVFGFRENAVVRVVFASIAVFSQVGLTWTGHSLSPTSKLGLDIYFKLLSVLGTIFIPLTYFVFGLYI